MFLIDTNVISELSRPQYANQGVINFFRQVQRSKQHIYLSVITIGEIKRGIYLLKHKNDDVQAEHLEHWLNKIIHQYQHVILDTNLEVAELWGKLCVPNHHNAIDKMIAATALMHDLTLVTRNIDDFKETNVKLLNPFASVE